MRLASAVQASAIDVQGQAFDIQAILASSFLSLHHATYWLLAIEDASAACDWLMQVLDEGHVKSVAELGRGFDPSSSDRKRTHHLKDCVTMAFSHAGLLALRVPLSEAYPFPTAFAMGMTCDTRAQLLDDTDVADWRWRDAPSESGAALGDDRGASVVHLLVVHFRKEPSPVAANSLIGADTLAARGFRVVGRVDNSPAFIKPVHGAKSDDEEERWHSSEPFGFRDGVARPLVDGLRSTRGFKEPSPDTEDSLIAAGEFVLGHEDEYGERAYAPDVDAWPARTLPDGSLSSFGYNGSYLVVRQIWQNVEAFAEFDGPKTHPPTRAPTRAELMIGRRRDGSSLVQCPVAPAGVDAFRYRTNDLDGFQCPRGAHIRRANPRDTLGWSSGSGMRSSKLHRLMRRGRPYCRMRGASEDEINELGLFFMALNSNLERQFELVHSRWVQGRSFGDLAGQTDPILGRARPTRFSTQALPVGRVLTGFASFTELRGGGYFFVPSLSALRYLAHPQRWRRACVTPPPAG